jgi:glycosyltransferase involved in cell wall biosynthesis
MEYMAAGKPIVAFDLAENRFSAGEAALYAMPNSHQDFAAKLAALMNDESMRALMEEAGRRRIETKLSWRHSIPDLSKVYDLISQP